MLPIAGALSSAGEETARPDGANQMLLILCSSRTYLGNHTKTNVNVMRFLLDIYFFFNDKNTVWHGCTILCQLAFCSGVINTAVMSCVRTHILKSKFYSLLTERFSFVWIVLLSLCVCVCSGVSITAEDLIKLLSVSLSVIVSVRMWAGSHYGPVSHFAQAETSV